MSIKHAQSLSRVGSKSGAHCYLGVTKQVNLPRWVGKFSVCRTSDAPVKRKLGGFLPGRPAYISVFFSAFFSLLTPLLLLSLLSSSSLANRYDHTAPMASVSTELWQATQKHQWASTVQVTFESIMADRNSNPLERLFEEIPSHFPNFKLNTLGRNLHSTVLYLDDLTLSDARSIIQFFKGLSPEVLNQYNLKGRFKFFDPNEEVEIMIAGRRSRFIALRPHKEFRDWQKRFWQMLGDLNPGLLNKHMSHRGLGEEAINPDHVHMSLIQYQAEGAVYALGDEPVGYAGPILSDAQGVAVVQQLTGLLRKVITNMKAEGLAVTPLYFNTEVQTLDLVTAPESIYSLPMPIVTMRATDSGYSISSIGRVKTPLSTTERPKIVDFNVEDFLAGNPLPVEQDQDFDGNWYPQARHFPPLDVAQFLSRIPTLLQEDYKRAELTLSPTKQPALIADEVGREYFVSTYAHPMLAPHKTFPILSSLRAYLPQSSHVVSVGSALYASSGREEILNPGDADLLVNSLVHVPDEIADFATAERFAVRHFLNHVLGHFLKLARQGSMAFIELRAGSRYTMGDYDHFEDIFDAWQDNPYLSEQDIERGYWTDSRGRRWSIEELIALGDFIKGKVDLFNQGPTGGRLELSLQFLLGFSWQGNTHFVQRNALKGVPPLMRTAVYDGAVSYAVATVLSRPSDYVGIRRGPLLARAVGDVLKAVYPNNHFDTSPPVLSQPVWSSKTLKKIYNFVVLLNRSGLGLDEIFLNETRRILQREGRWPEGYNYSGLKDVLLGAVNQEAIALLNALKRNINDLREYNERHQTMRDDMWLARREEIKVQLAGLSDLLASDVVSPGHEFQRSYGAFVEAFNNAQRTDSMSRAVRYMRSRSRYNGLLNFENALTELENHFNASAFSRAAINEADKLFLQTMVSYSPLILYRYYYNRTQELGNNMRWALRFMKIDISNASGDPKIKIINDVARNLDQMTRAQVAQSQRLIFAKIPHTETGNNIRCVYALTPVINPTGDE